MKILLAVMMTTVIAGSAYGACSKDAVNECVTEQSCVDLGKNSDIKYSFNDKNPVKCMAINGPVATNCTENPNSARTAGKSTDGSIVVDDKKATDVKR